MEEMEEEGANGGAEVLGAVGLGGAELLLSEKEKERGGPLGRSAGQQRRR